MNHGETPKFENPFKPGAGHKPPYLAGRQEEELEFRELLKQTVVLKNLILTGLRGVGKTVLLESLKPIAIDAGWVMVGTDLSESASISEENLAMRVLTDISLVTSGVSLNTGTQNVGFMQPPTTVNLNYASLRKIYNETPGLVSDKLKFVLEYVWNIIKQFNKRGVIFAYDEAQNLSDRANKEQYPLSLILDVFASIQKKEIPFMLVLTGLPTLFPTLVEARAYTERMFRVITLGRLSLEATREAISVPIEKAGCPVTFDAESIDSICRMSGGYPYFIQFICKEVYDRWIQQLDEGEDTVVPQQELVQKLDSDFYAGRWAKVTDRQKHLLQIIAKLPNHDSEFAVQDIVEASKTGSKPFSSSHVGQMLSTLNQAGLVYKNRYGKYSFAVPMFGDFIRRHSDD
jgi:hypothetical protein